MKNVKHVAVKSIDPFGLNKLFWRMMNTISSKITRNKKIDSFANDICSTFILSALTLSFIYGVIYTRSYSSGWNDLEKHYGYHNVVEYQRQPVTLALVDKRNKSSDRHDFESRVMLNHSGFFIAPNLPFHSPVFIPWESIEKCTKDSNTAILLHVKNVDSMLRFNLWNFLSPMCEKRGL